MNDQRYRDEHAPEKPGFVSVPGRTRVIFGGDIGQPGVLMEHIANLQKQLADERRAREKWAEEAARTGTRLFAAEAEMARVRQERDALLASANNGLEEMDKAGVMIQQLRDRIRALEEDDGK